MSELTDAYVKGYEAGWRIGREAERKYILALARKASFTDELGEGVYFNDLEEYLKDEDEKISK